MWAWSEGDEYPHLIDPPKAITLKPIFSDCAATVSVNGTELNEDNNYTYEVTDDAATVIKVANANANIYFASSEGAAANERTEIIGEGVQYTGSFPATLFYGTADDFDAIGKKYSPR